MERRGGFYHPKCPPVTRQTPIITLGPREAVLPLGQVAILALARAGLDNKPVVAPESDATTLVIDDLAVNSQRAIFDLIERRWPYPSLWSEGVNRYYEMEVFEQIMHEPEISLSMLDKGGFFSSEETICKRDLTPADFAAMVWLNTHPTSDAALAWRERIYTRLTEEAGPQWD